MDEEKKITQEEVKIKKEESSKIFPLLEKISFWVMTALVFLLPFFFIPSISVPFLYGKNLLYGIAVLIVFILWIIGRLKDGKIFFSASAIFFSLIAIVFISLISALFSPSFNYSFIGDGLETGTVAFILISFIVLFMVPTIFQSKNKNRIFYFYSAFFISFFVVAFYQIFRLFMGPEYFSFGILTTPISNLIGKWNDLGIYYGLVLILSFITLENLKLTNFLKILVGVSLVVSFFGIVVTNFFVLWVVIAIFSFIVAIYQFFINEKGLAVKIETIGMIKQKKLPRISITILVVSLIFIFFSYLPVNVDTGLPHRFNIGNIIANKFNTVQTEARLSWTSTVEISKKTLSKDFLLGAGPNRFVFEWLLNKPKEVNETIYWNTDFNFATGIIPTYAITTGILGFLAWILFFILLLYKGICAILSPSHDSFSRYFILSSFFASVYLWVFAFIYIPSYVIYGFAFLFTGIFLASTIKEKIISKHIFDIFKNPAIGFVSILILIFVLIGSITFGYTIVGKTLAVMYFQKGLIMFNSEKNLDKVESYIKQAVSFDENDIYYRALTEVYLSRMNMILLEQNNTNTEDLKSRFWGALTKADKFGKKAIEINKSNYQNHVSFGRIFESVLPLKIEGAYEKALESYEKAIGYNPSNPALYLIIAKLEVAKAVMDIEGDKTKKVDMKKARESILKAITLKNNYTEAIFLLSQIEAQEGNIKSAIQALEATVHLAPNNIGLLFELGLLRYNDKNYKDAIVAFEQAIILDPIYANAKYFLGLSYDRVGRKADAIKQFEDIKKTNQDNVEVKKILENLRAGRDSFTNVNPPDNTPEKRKKLPVKEN